MSIRPASVVRALLAGCSIGLLASAPVSAHHNSQAEYGPFGSPTMYVEGTIVGIHWGNPHVSFDMETTGGDIPAGEKWRFESHPISIPEMMVGGDRHAVPQAALLQSGLEVRDTLVPVRGVVTA